MHSADCLCYQVEAEEVPDVTDRYGVTVVPYFLIVKVLSQAALSTCPHAKLSQPVHGHMQKLTGLSWHAVALARSAEALLHRFVCL